MARSPAVNLEGRTTLTLIFHTMIIVIVVDVWNVDVSKRKINNVTRGGHTE